MGNVLYSCGGWLNIVAKYAEANVHCGRSFEYRFTNKHKRQVSMDGEWIDFGIRVDP